jgi:AcrR family transcriptional regulator
VRRDTILEAALEVFGASSFASATTAEIARAAGVSEPILYRHFPSKKALYIACLEQSWERLRAAWEDAISGSPPGDALTAVSQATIALAQGGTVLPPTLWMQAFAEAGRDGEIRDAVRRVMREVHDAVEGALSQAQAAGVVHRDREPEIEAWIVVSSLLLHTLSARVGGLLRQEDVERIRAQRRRWLTGSS